MRSPSRFFRPTQFVGLVLVGLALLIGGVAGGAEGASSSTQTAAASIPTWGNLYDWPNGHGYVGWHAASSSPGDYGMQPALGGGSGLWLWAKGGQHVYTKSDYAEWTYTAPGTTRLQSMTLSFAYRNKLLAHHCIEIGFRTLAGALITHQDFCQPAHPPDSQDLTNVSLDDPAPSAPSSKVLYLRIHVDCGGAATCTKTIPQLDPLATGGYVRFLKVAMTLVDDDNPVAQPSGPLWDIRDHYVDGTSDNAVTLDATDAGSGIASSSLTHASKYPESTKVVGGRTAPCDPLHNTPALDNRICPPEFSWQTTVDTNPYPEGPNTFTESATDMADNVGTNSWTIYIDRTPPDAVDVSGSLYDDAGLTIGGTTPESLTISAHDPGADVEKASGIGRVWLEEQSQGVVGEASNPDCTDTKCPDTFSSDFVIDLTAYPEGTYTFTAYASDLVGHVTTGPTWTVTIDRSEPPDTDTGPDDSAIPPGTDPGFVGGGADDYDPSADSARGCDAYADFGVDNACASPTPTADAPTDVTATTATVNGQIDVHQLATSYYFEWQGGGSSGTTPEAMVDDFTPSPVTATADLSGLAPGTSYQVRLAAYTDSDPVYSDWQTFQTQAGDVMFAAPRLGLTGPGRVTSQMITTTTTHQAAPHASTLATGYSGCGFVGLFWSVSAPPKILSEALMSHPLRPACGSYYFAHDTSSLEPACLPGVRVDTDVNKKWPSNFHAAPVFNWSAWYKWVNNQAPFGDGQTHTWYAAGQKFRQAIDANPDCNSGDRWTVNEFPSSWRANVLVKPDGTSRAVTEQDRRKTRHNIVDALNGLYHGDASEPDLKGFGAEPNVAPDDPNLVPYHQNLERAFTYGTGLFKAANQDLLSWSKEVYNKCSEICKPGASAVQIANGGVNPYSFHQPLLVQLAPGGSASEARTMFATRYMPLMNAFWDASDRANRSYDSQFGAPLMAKVVREEVYSARLVAGTQSGANGRIGFAWHESGFSTPQADSDIRMIARNLAVAIQAAYGPAGSASLACRDNDPNGPLYVGCSPHRSGANFNDNWARSFDTTWISFG